MQTVSSPNFNIHFHIDNHHHYAVSQTSPITHGYTTLTLASSDLRSLTAARKTRQSILGSDWYDSKCNADIRMLLKTSWRPLEDHLRTAWISLRDPLMIKWRSEPEWWRLSARQMDTQILASLELLSEPKIELLFFLMLNDQNTNISVVKCCKTFLYMLIMSI